MNTDYFRKLLQQQRKQILEVLDSGKSAAGTVKLDQTSVGRLSRMDALQSQAMLQEATRRREQSLRDISVALRKIDAGDYGFCKECGEEIAEKRLQVNPTVDYCIECSSSREK
ncbi:MAG: TraR/DksA family transcriptional regulator [Pseudomonadota bacterium]|nr:TraR/DksA family transcriptional regulator [Pseudomonadota bacterium]